VKIKAELEVLKLTSSCLQLSRMRRFASPARRYNQILAIALVLTASALFSLSNNRHHFQPDSCESTSNVAPAVWETIARARLSHLQSRFKQEDTFQEMGLKIGNPAWDEYVNELQDVYQRFFKPAAESEDQERTDPIADGTSNGTSAVRRIQEKLNESFNDLSKHVGHPEYERLSEFIPHTIHTTSKKPIFPSEFATWDRMNAEDGWAVEFWDDERIWRWMKQVFGRSGGTSDEDSGQTEGARILDVYEQVPQGVLRGEHDAPWSGPERLTYGNQPTCSGEELWARSVSPMLSTGLCKVSRPANGRR
jgi:hypothetical protein